MTDDRMVAGSNPSEADWKLWQFPLYLTLPVSFGRDTKAVGPICLMSMPGEVKVKNPIQGGLILISLK